MPVILLVEDDPEVRTLMEAALSERGLEIRVAEDDRGAYRILDREAGQIAVLITDIALGRGPTGFDVARRAQRLNPRMQVLYVTGQALKMDSLGVEGGVLFPKPFNLGDLADMAEAMARALP
jgi:DNA-binding response OmpR family regulator